jgi:hypothetical protein
MVCTYTHTHHNVTEKQDDKLRIEKSVIALNVETLFNFETVTLNHHETFTYIYAARCESASPI